MLSVYYDFQVLFAQKYGGISRYFFELISRLPQLGAEVSINCLRNRNYYFAERLGLTDMTGKNKIFRLAELGTFWYANKLKTKIELSRKHFDIIHPTYYHVNYNKNSKRKLIHTVHDLVQERYINQFPEIKRRIIAAKKKSVYSADRLIAVSEHTKKDMLEFFPDIAPEKISVIYHGASMQVQHDHHKNFSRMNGKDYILFVGLRGRYKNFNRFLKAMLEIMDKYKDLYLFCAGGGAFTDEELKNFGGYSSRIYQAGLSDEELADAYSNALCFVFPSEYEGFGIPVLEAFACNCPLVCSNSSSLPEIALDGAEYFDPLNIDDIGAKILRVIENKSLCKKITSAGKERLKFFNWDKTAKETLECYNMALKN